MASRGSIADNSAPYQDPSVAASLDSLEGVPSWPSTRESAGEIEARRPWQRRMHLWFGGLGSILPGLCLALGLAVLGKYLSQWLGERVFSFSKSPFSAIMFAIVLGLLIRNVVGLPAVYEKGLRLCVKRILRIGIVLLGMRMSLLAAGKIGLVGLPIILGCMAAALVFVSLASRGLGLPRKLGSLIAVGTSICGVSAIIATAPAIDADEDEVSYAVATITLFGMITLFAYPYAAHWVFADDAHLIGLFLGTAIHDTAQVAGAGLMYQQQYAAPEALDTAVVVKLVRNLCMVFIIPLMTVLHHRQSNPAASAGRPRWYQLIPLFVVGFVAMVVLRTVGDIGARPFGLLSSETWHDLNALAQHAAKWCLMIAMASIGLGTSIKRLRILGLRPLVAGLFAAALVGGVSVVLVKWLGNLM
jgi:uncharacterized integral membrane protein (TIGR00698 family)